MNLAKAALCCLLVSSCTVSEDNPVDIDQGRKSKSIVADKTYTIGTNDYYTAGFYGILRDAKFVKLTSDQICKTLADFIEKDLGGVVGDDYRQSQGRITFIED